MNASFHLQSAFLIITAALIVIWQPRVSAAPIQNANETESVIELEELEEPQQPEETPPQPVPSPAETAPVPEPLSAAPEEVPIERLEHGPFYSIYPSPLYIFLYQFPTDGVQTTPAGHVGSRIQIDYANILDATRSDTSTVWLDTELFHLRASLSIGLFEHTDVTIQVPLTFMWGGFMDPIIYFYHDILHFPQGGRSDVIDMRHDVYLWEGDENRGRYLFDVPSKSPGIGNISLVSKTQLMEEPFRFGLRFALAVPGGEKRIFTGTEAFQGGAGLLAEKTWSLYTLYLNTSVSFFERDGFLNDVMNLPFLFTTAAAHELRVSKGWALMLESEFFLSPYKGFGLGTLESDPFTLTFGASFKPVLTQSIKFYATEDLMPRASVDIAFTLVYEALL